MAGKSGFIPIIVEFLFKCLVFGFHALTIGLCLPAFFVFNRTFDNFTLFYHYLLFMPLLAMIVLSLVLKFLRPLSIFCALLIALTLFLPFGRDLIKNGPAKVEGTALPFKVVTFNALTQNQNVQMFNNWLRAEQPDIVALQEVNKAQANNVKDLSDIYPYSTLRDENDDVTIISRLPIISQKHIGAPGDHRSIVYARLRSPQGDIDVYALHSDTIHTKAQWIRRNEYLTMAATVIDPTAERIIVLGDFNASPWNHYYNGLVAAGDLHAEPRLFPPVTRVVSTQNGKPIGAAIDHILTNGKHRLSNCRPYASMGSDHLPVMCKLTFTSRP